MRATGYRKPSPELDHLEAVDIPRPKPEGRDLLVEVRAVSVNPVDYKVASGAGPGGAASDTGAIKVVGYDAAGVVAETGPEASLFKSGDEVFYAGSIGRQGADMEFHLVDERIVGRKPRTLDFAAAAALPLTSIPPRGFLRIPGPWGAPPLSFRSPSKCPGSCFILRSSRRLRDPRRCNGRKT